MKQSFRKNSGRKSEHRCHHERRIDRRERAAEREQARKNRPVTEQIRLLERRPGNSDNEMIRLRTQLENDRKKKK